MKNEVKHTAHSGWAIQSPPSGVFLFRRKGRYYEGSNKPQKYAREHKIHASICREKAWPMSCDACMGDAKR